MKQKVTSQLSKGFTLIELLVVIAILGILAGAVLVAVNPGEQLARGRDSGRKSAVNQLGRALQAYYTAQVAYPAQGSTWMETLVNFQEIKTRPSNPSGGSYVGATGPGCNTTAVAQNGYCYLTGTVVAGSVEAIVYARIESTSDKQRSGTAVGSPTPGCVDSGEQAWIVWSSADGKSGLTCISPVTTDPALGITGLL